MACTSCKTKISGACKVCSLLDNDNKVKTVKYCIICGVHICIDCDKDLDRRWKAFLKHKLGI